MNDISDYFKNGFLSLHKNAIGKTYQQKTLKDRMCNFNNFRRETRNTLMLQKRQIDENMSPINTPEPTKLVRKVVERKEVNKPNKRLEMLKKWKAEKEKRKQEEQKKVKPLFKYCHVPVLVGLPDLENVNKEIKGKPIKAAPTPVKSQFAPLNHKFRPPKNIKPINLNNHTNVVSQRNTRSSSRTEQASNDKFGNSLVKKFQTKTEIGRLDPGQNNDILQKKLPVDLRNEDENKFRLKIKEPPQKNTSNIGTRKKPVIENNSRRDVKCSSPKNNRRNEKTTNHLFKNEKYRKNVGKELNASNMETVKEIKKTPKKNNIKFVDISNSQEVGHEKKTSSKMLKRKKNDTSTSHNRRKSANITPKKTVGWDVIQFLESSEVFAKQISDKASKTFKKTPKKAHKKEKIEGNTIEGTLTNAVKEEKNLTETVDNDELFSKVISNKTPEKTPKRVTRKYRNTPRKQSTEKIEDNTMEETLTNEENTVKNLYSESKNAKNKTPKKNKSLNNCGEKAGQIVRNIDVKSSNSTIGSATGSASPDYPVEYVHPGNESLNISSHTPVKNGSREISPAYISPFVTVSRGKNSARKEYQVRHSVGICLNDTPEIIKDISDNISPKAGADYFTRKLNYEIARLEAVCADWDKYKEYSDCPEEANDMIDVAIGQSRLLISKKFRQFRDLIDQCKNCEYKEKPVTCEDLHGFWDMIYMQVGDLNKRFNSLDVLKAHNWQEVIPEKKPVVKRGRGRPKKVTATSSLKNLIKAARSKKNSNGEEGNNLTSPHSQGSASDNGHCLIRSPVIDGNIPTLRASSARQSLRMSLLSVKTKNRMSSPGLTMMKISQAIKCGDGLTPSKSILKTDLSKSINKPTKSVLFKEDLEDNIEKHVKSMKTAAFKKVEDSLNKENDSNEINLISFSPVTPIRRSQRLSKIN